MATLKYRNSDGTYTAIPAIQGPPGPAGSKGDKGDTPTLSDIGAAAANHTHTGMWTSSNLKFSLSGTTLTITTS